MNIQKIVNRSLPVFKKYRVKKAALFGSVVRGTDTPTSDIDFLIDPPENFSLMDLAGLKVDLEDANSCPVDLVEYHMIKPILRNAILKYEYPIL